MNQKTFSKSIRTLVAPRGFALVITLLLMVLLVIIAVGLLSLSSVVLRSSSHDEAQSQANANARMALILAIGELQRELGADKRVNATSAILSDDNGKTTSAKEGRRHWLGAYDSWDSTSESARPSSPKFRGWLVSGPDAIRSDINAPKTAAPEDVTLWTGVESDGSDRVLVPKQKITSERFGGGLAWWVGDENSKALVSRMPDDTGNMARVRADTQSAPTTAFQNAEALAGIDRISEKLDVLASHKTLELAANPSASEKTFHDFTVFSQGVLSDVARGGLKRDLSLFLDHPVSKPSLPKLPNERRLYQNGITWEELWLYHNVWRELEPPEPRLASMTGGNLSGSHLLMTKPGIGLASRTAFFADPFALYKLPTYLRPQWLLSIWAKQKPGISPVQYDVFWVSDPIITLWNPLDVPIALHPDAYMMYRFWYIPYTIQLLDEAGVPVTAGENHVTPGDDRSPYSLIVGTGPTTSGQPAPIRRDPVVLMPGEVLIMSEGPEPGEPIPYNSNQQNIATKAGWGLGRGRSAPITFLRPVSPSESLSFKVSPNTRRMGANSQLVNLHYYYGTDTTQVGVGIREISNPLRAPSHPSVFPTITGDLPPMATMTGAGKHPFFLFSLQTKSEDHTTAWSSMHHPRILRSMMYDLTPQGLAMSGHEVKVDGLSGSRDSKMIQLSSNQINRGLFGGSYWDHQRGTDTLITHSIPREPPLSLGAFQHAIANGITNRTSGGALRTVAIVSEPELPHAISNSYALPVLSPEHTQSSNFTDHSYHVNRMLWDSWFLSGIVQRQAPHHDVKKTAEDVYYSDFLSDPSASPPNRRIIATPEAVSAGVGALFETNGDAKSDAHEIASSKLMVEGAFNVNSTSVEAWKAILGSLDAAFVPVAEGTNSPASVATHESSDGVPVISLLSSFGSGASRDSAAFDAGVLASAGNASQWRGYRKLTHSEIGELAKALVEEIRKRGPFLSMADFINRRPGSDTNLALCGPLQAALDRTVNAALFAANGRVGTAPPNAFVFPAAAQLPKSAASPAHVRQADILTPIGTHLSVRSDTFRIRAYGESTDKNGKVLARAWCEAIVQRVPEYLDPYDPPEAADPPSPDPEPRSVPALTSLTNKAMGRRLEIRSFRWISKQEI